jgi:DNA-binding response OmpR family regulator
MKKKNGYKILVVDDQIGVVSFLFDFFTRKGYSVSQARDAKKAVETVKREKPDLVLLDVRLGWGKDGIDALKEIKEIEPKTHVIMMTGVTEEDVVEEAKRLGAEDYIIKPFSLSYLERVVALKILKLQIEEIGKSEV